MSAEKHRELKRVKINKNVSFQLSLMDRSARGGLSDRWVYLEAGWIGFPKRVGFIYLFLWFFFVFMTASFPLLPCPSWPWHSDDDKWAGDLV